MKHLIIMAALLISAATATSQQLIKIEELKQHIGDSVTICTKIYGGIFLDRSNGTPTLLNAGADYPNSPLTIFIGPDARKTFNLAPEQFFKGKDVCVTGKIMLYKEKPEIVVYDVMQLIVQQ